MELVQGDALKVSNERLVEILKDGDVKNGDISNFRAAKLETSPFPIVI